MVEEIINPSNKPKVRKYLVHVYEIPVAKSHTRNRIFFFDTQIIHHIIIEQNSSTSSGILVECIRRAKVVETTLQ